MKFRKKPVVIDAWHFTNEPLLFAPDWIQLSWFIESAEGKFMIIPTLEGDHKANVGDWIIRGVKGEVYPCKPDIFEMTYEPVEQP